MTDAERYKKACHAMQTGVAFTKDKADQAPKHLRVGVNVALRDQSSLVGLLIAKGVFTREEYMKAIADGMEEEAAGYEDQIRDELRGDGDGDGPRITLA